MKDPASTDGRRTSGYTTSYARKDGGLRPRTPGLKSPKKKGDAYERELAAYFSSLLGIAVHRTPLSGGGCGFARSSLGPSADLTGTPDLWIEAKRTERFAPRDAMAQALKGLASKPSCPDMPVVINRPGHTETGDSLCVIRLKDFMKLYSAYLDMAGITRAPLGAAPANSPEVDSCFTCDDNPVTIDPEQT